jgi:hypothetical protein
MFYGALLRGNIIESNPEHLILEVVRKVRIGFIPRTIPETSRVWR